MMSLSRFILSYCQSAWVRLHILLLILIFKFKMPQTSSFFLITTLTSIDLTFTSLALTGLALSGLALSGLALSGLALSGLAKAKPVRQKYSFHHIVASQKI
jgi:hypothetical protein